MRILALRGENLASLPRFAFDLESDPLVDAGLFAITGETGAGKSTLLDALCLALYGDYPRASVSRRESAPDPSGEAIAVKDARNILRRGAASGYAEVDFVGGDGHRYRARWETRRARNTAAGKLQKVERRIDRIENGIVTESVATGISEVLQAVHSLTGLTFDQFCRTALLAQGEFDAFLLSDENERAELLEMITGTEVYGRLSIAVHEAAADRRLDIVSREAVHDAVTLLDASERDALAAHIAQGDTTQRELTEERSSLVHSLDQARRRRSAAAILADAERALFSARAAEANVAEDRKRLALLDRLAPVSAKAAAMRAAEQELTEATARRSDGDKRASEAATASAHATVAWQKAVAADLEASRSYESFEPLWREADQLEAQLETAARELAAAQAHAESALQQAQAGLAALADFEAETALLRTERETVVRENEANVRHAILAQRALEITTELERYGSTARDVQSATRIVDSARADMQRIATQVREAEQVVTAATAERDALGEILVQKRAAGRADVMVAAETQDRALDEARFMLREAEDTARSWREAENSIVVAREATARARQALADAEHRQALSEEDHDKTEAIRRELIILHDLAEATASEAAELLRTTLVAAEPCPVCGSVEHPFVTGEQGAAEHLVAEIRRRRDELDAQIRDLGDSVTDARGDAAEARAQMETSARQANLATEEKARLAAHYAALAKPLVQVLALSQLPHLVPAALDVRTSHAIAQIAADAERARSVYAGRLARVRDLRSSIDALQTDYDAAQRRREEAMRQMDRLGLDRRDAERALSVAESQLRQCEASQAAVMRALEPVLLAADLTPADLDEDAEACREYIVRLATAYTGRNSRRKAIDSRIQELTVEAAAARSTQRAALEMAERAKTQLAQRRDEVERATSARALLFAGLDGKVHRETITAERNAKAAARGEAIAAQQERALAHAAAIERAEAYREAFRQAELRVAEARLALSAAVGPLGVPEPEALAMLAMPLSDIDALRLRLDALARSLVEAVQVEAMRRSDLEALLASGTLDIDDVATEQRIRDLEEAVSSARDGAAAARARLALDAAARARAGALAAELETARAELATWDAVDKAIGSANGDKFRRFAQGITLDQLIRLANDQLRAVNPRYRLGRNQSTDLALHVIDRDMGDEQRSVRSLSGGERFHVSLALALALSGLEGRQSFVDTLFIDEGFGSLDAETLDMAIDALETLHSQGRKVGVITHVAAMIERIPVQIRVEKRGHGRSTVRVISRDTLPDKAA